MEKNNKTSLICACKNRYRPLLVSLQSWLLYEEISEIIVVDWSSDDSIKHITSIDPKIKVITVSNEQFFNQPQPLNLALKLCTQKSVVKVDTDYIFNPYWNFFQTYSIDDTSFVSGDTDVDLNHNINSPYFKHLRGLLYVHKKLLDKVGGYNEDMGEYYAGEDTELENRLKLYGLTHKKINFDHTVIHIPHSDKKRLENFKAYTYDSINNAIKENISGYSSTDELEWQADYAIAQTHIQQNLISYCSPSDYYVEPKTKWNITQVDNQNYTAEKV